MSEMLFCENRNEFHHQDRYGGEDYVFPPHQKVMLSMEAAQHVMHRLGWSFKYNPETKTFYEDKDAVTKLKNFIFTKARMVEETPDATPRETLTLKK